MAQPDGNYIPPPPYCATYTDEAVKNGRVRKPPKPPVGEYKMYGVTYNTEEDLVPPWLSRLKAEIEPEFKRLASGKNIDHKRELQKLSRSVLLNYLALLDTLTADPAEYIQHFYGLATLFNNMHAVINDYRPHQARATLRAMMENQCRRREDMIDVLQSHFDAVDEALQQCVSSILPRADTHYSQFEKTTAHEDAVASLPEDRGLSMYQAEREAARHWAELCSGQSESQWDELLDDRARAGIT